MSNSTAKEKDIGRNLGQTRGPVIKPQKTTVIDEQSSGVKAEEVNKERSTLKNTKKLQCTEQKKSPTSGLQDDHIQTALSEIKQRCDVFGKFADQFVSTVQDDAGETTLAGAVQAITELLKKYRQGLAVMYMERIFSCRLNEEYEKASEYTRELASLVNILENEELEDAKRIVAEDGMLTDQSTKFANLVVLQKRHCEYFGKVNTFLNICSTPDAKRSEYDIFLDFFYYYMKSFKLQKSLDIISEYLRMASILKDKTMEDIFRERKGLVYSVLGKQQEAYKIFKPLLKDGIEHERSNMSLVVNTSVVLLLLAQKEGSLEKKKESLRYALNSLKLGEKADDYEVTAVAHGNIGLAHESMGNFELAIHHYEKCLLLGEQNKEDRIINNSYCNLGRAYEATGKDKIAMEYYEKAEKIPQPAYCHWNDTEDMRFSGDYLLGKMLIKHKEWQKAKEHFQSAVERCETQRKSIQKSPEKIIFNDQQGKPYQYLQHLQLQLGEKGEALLVAEKARARDFYDKIVQKKQNKVPLNSIEDIQAFVKKHNVAVLMLSTLEVVDKLCGWLILPDGRIKDFSVQNINWKKLLQKFCVSIHLLHVRNLTETRGLESDETDQELAEGFCNAPEPSTKDSLSASSILRTGDSAACAEEIEKAFSQFTECIEELSSLVLQPIENDLDELVKDSTEKPKLVFIPQLLTFNIPFAALDLHGEPLCKSITPLEAFSFHSLSHANSQAKKPELGKSEDNLVVGDPTLDLKNAEKEAIVIAKLLKTTPLIGNQATRSNVMSRLPHARIIHLACHGSTDGKSLYLASDISSSERAKFTVADITKVDADLVVLSACHTHRGKVSNEGILGLCRAFIMAGAKSVVTTLWAVPDEATLYFMEKFYKKLISGDHVADALAMTMAEMSDRYEHFYWGAFKHVGANCKILF